MTSVSGSPLDFQELRNAKWIISDRLSGQTKDQGHHNKAIDKSACIIDSAISICGSLLCYDASQRGSSCFTFARDQTKASDMIMRDTAGVGCQQLAPGAG